MSDYNDGYDSGYQDAENRYKTSVRIFIDAEKRHKEYIKYSIDVENQYRANIQHYVEGLQEELEKRQNEFYEIATADMDVNAKVYLSDVAVGRIASLKFAIKLAEERML